VPVRGKKGMKRTASALTLILALLILLAAGVQTVKAQYTPSGQGFPLVSPISITSPSNSTYSSNRLTLSVAFKFLLSSSYANVSYSVDGKSNVTIPLTGTQEPMEVTRTYANGTTVIVNSTLFVPFIITGGVTLPELTEGSHNITVYARYQANNDVGLDNSTVYFTINTNSEQNIPEFPAWTILPLTMTATIIAVVLKRKRL
jgi:hypothetical protein